MFQSLAVSLSMKRFASVITFEPIRGGIQVIGIPGFRQS